MVAGCLFEVTLPTHGVGPGDWEPADPPEEVTLLEESHGQSRSRFRFRAERPPEGGCSVVLRFRVSEPVVEERSLCIHVAPEHF